MCWHQKNYKKDLLTVLQAYSTAGVLPYALDQLRWAATFLMAAHIAPLQYVAQVSAAVP